MEKKNIRDWNKRWYEYHRPRKPEVMMAPTKIITPRLAKEIRFFLDTNGTVPQDSCICLVPTKKTRGKFEILRRALAKVLGRRVSVIDVLKYCLAFLNSPYSQERFTTGHRPRPGEVYAVTVDFLKEIPIPPPRGKGRTENILNSVGCLITETDEIRLLAEEKKLFKLVMKMLGVK